MEQRGTWVVAFLLLVLRGCWSVTVVSSGAELTRAVAAAENGSTVALAAHCYLNDTIHISEKDLLLTSTSGGVFQVIGKDLGPDAFRLFNISKSAVTLSRISLRKVSGDSFPFERGISLALDLADRHRA